MITYLRKFSACLSESKQESYWFASPTDGGHCVFTRVRLGWKPASGRKTRHIVFPFYATASDVSKRVPTRRLDIYFSLATRFDFVRLKKQKLFYLSTMQHFFIQVKSIYS